MFKICIFAGTTEGRELAELLKGRPVSVSAFTATEYGGSLIEAAGNVSVSSGRLDEEEMRALFSKERYDLVVDATHPYAAVVTENIAKACEETGTGYLRVLREGSALPEDAVFVSDAKEAASFLDETEGSILLTTGSKELSVFAPLKDFSERVFARVLPMESSLKACEEAGLPPSRIIAMQGPFTEEMNAATLSMCHASWLVTKESGKAGGFDEKLSAARKAGARLLVIGRPPQREGVSLGEAVKIIEERAGLIFRPSVIVAGIGPGAPESATLEVIRAVKEADCLIGAKRMIQAYSEEGKPAFDAVAPAAIAKVIEENRQFRRFTVLMSGDSGFYSGTKKLLPMLSGCDVRVLPGVSSLSLLCARLGLSYEDIPTASLHGRDYPIEDLIRRNARVFAMTGGSDGVNRLCERLIGAGLADTILHVGERLSYPDEKITTGSPEELRSMTFDSLSAVIIEDPCPDGIVTGGLPDDAFVRGADGTEVVPMTKSEVRAVCLSKLRLTESSVCWDVGAGTGSVSVEMALKAPRGHVYAVEKKDAAADLIEINRKALGASNVTVVRGTAPEACKDLPAPTHVFIGGSSGNMKEIIALALSKTPDARIVATAVTLESVSELTSVMKEFGPGESEAVLLSVSRDRKAGPYHLMNALNPVYIFTMQHKSAEGGAL